MAEGRSRRVFREMLREEWRMHSTVFSGSRFAAFPLIVLAFVAGATGLLVVTGTSATTVLAGLHALALVFGLHTGSIGFVGRDTLRNLLGDVTLLVFSARTLPLSQRRLLGIFIVKDVVYYAALFLVPIAVGSLPALLSMHATPLSAALALGLLWATLTLAFVLGIGITIAALGLTARGVPGAVLGGGLAAIAVGAWLGGYDVLAPTPYGVFVAPTLPRIGGAVLLVAAVYVVGAITFNPGARRPARSVRAVFRRWADVLGDPIAAKALLDVHRSSGGFGKVLFSAAILYGVTAALQDLAGQITGVTPSVAITFGTVLGLSGFTTYNWLTQGAAVDTYLFLPLEVADVLTGTFRAFLVLGPVVGLAFYAVALAWYGSGVAEALVGGLLLVGVATYIFGVTVGLTGLSPNEFLFDSALFAVFAVAMIVPLVPILVVAFALAPVSLPLLAGLGLGGVALAGVGVVVYRRSRARWSRHYRSA